MVLVLSLGCLLFSVTGCSTVLRTNPNRIPTPAAPSAQAEAQSEELIRNEEIVIGLLLLAASVSIVSQRLRIPYTVGLVVVGLGLAFVGRIPVEPIAPELILALLVPPLIFEGAFHLNFNELRRMLGSILVLAVPGVILTTLLVGVVVSIGSGLQFSTGLVFGALIAATDPVAVIALFRSLGAPKRLQILLEGESLLNDGTAIMIFNLMLVYTLTGQFSLPDSLREFVVVAGGGILIGAVMGVLVAQLINRIDDYLVETALTVVLAYGAYLIAEEIFGVSGVLAVVAAGLATGNLGPRGMSPTTRIVLFNFWEFLAFLANSFVFLLIGLQIDLNLLFGNLTAILWAIAAVLAARAVTIYGLSWLGQRTPMKWKNVLFWGGLRGAISLALTLSLTADVPNREQIQAMAFGVVLFTLVVEGLTMGPLVRWMGLTRLSESQREYERRHARAIAVRSGQVHLKRLNTEGLITDFTWQTLSPLIKDQAREKAQEVREVLEEDPALQEEEIKDAWREYLRTQRSALTKLYRDNIVPEEIYQELVAEVDLQFDDAQISSLFLKDDKDPEGED